jgi:hypothetical protein
MAAVWSGSLQLTPRPARHLAHFANGRFFTEFMARFLPWAAAGQTTAETYRELEVGLRAEFPFGEVVDCALAMEGDGQELLKALTLLLFLGTVRHHSKQLSDWLQDGLGKEDELRLKCVLQAVLEQQAALTPGLLATILLAGVIENTGHLREPLPISRLAARPTTRAAPPVSPIGPSVIQVGSGGKSPVKRDSLDSPGTCREMGHRLQLDQKNVQIR